MRAGEIIGIAGVDGNGQTELIDAVTGLLPVDEGRVVVAGRDVTRSRTRTVIEAGLGHIPEDRHRRGLVLDFTLAENLALEDYREPPDSRFGWLFPRRLIARARALIKEFDIRGGGPNTRASTLSGGNQQKVVIAREVHRDPRALLAAQPTRGLDIGAVEFVHRRLAGPSCSSPSSWTRPSRSPTGSWSCTRGASSPSTRPTSPKKSLDSQ